MLDLWRRGFGRKFLYPPAGLLAMKGLEGVVAQTWAAEAHLTIDRATGQVAMTGIAPPRF